MPCIGKKTARIGKHTHKISEKRKIGERFKLCFHSRFGIVEPPCRAVLNLTRRLCALKTAENGVYHLVVAGVKRINNRLRQFTFYFKRVEKSRKRFAAVSYRYTVKAGIRTESTEHFTVGIPLCAVMKLHYYSLFGYLFT